jgi:hypothetical protein
MVCYLVKHRDNFTFTPISVSDICILTPAIFMAVGEIISQQCLAVKCLSLMYV